MILQFDCSNSFPLSTVAVMGHVGLTPQAIRYVLEKGGKKDPKFLSSILFFSSSLAQIQFSFFAFFFTLLASLVVFELKVELQLEHGPF